jgi:hypothetical protein
MPNFIGEDGTLPDETQIPSYLLAADNHNIGNSRGGSWLEPDTWGDKLEGAGKLIATGILSGANSFYNTGVTVANWFGADAELSDTKSFISNLDDDLGVYYGEHRQAADLVGFIAGSLIPGLGGIKILNAGQTALKAASATGRLGSNLSRATGLLVPQTEMYIAAAAKDISSAAATFSSISQNGIKALASGVGQNFLEGMAFETAVQATMFKSPILEQQDGWDILKNIAIGGAVQGAIGGAFSAASTLGKIKKLVGIADKEVKPFSSRVVAESGTSPADKIILMTEDRTLSEAPVAGSENFAAQTEAYTDKLRRIDNDIRTQYHELVKGNDTELGNMLADAHQGLDHTVALQNLLGAEEVTRLGTLTAVEREANAAVKAGKTPEPGNVVSYLKLTGEGAGTVSDSAPTIANLADRVSTAKDVTTEARVLSEVRDYNFKPGQNWNALALRGENSHLEAEARYIWADKVLKEIKPDTLVNQYDLPVLERALKDKTLEFKLVDDAGGVLKNRFMSTRELEAHIIEAKQTAASELLRTHVFEGNIPVEQGTQAIAKIVNTKLARLEGTVGDDSKDFFAWQSANEEYKQFLAARKLQVAANESGDTRFLPTYAKIGRRTKDFTDLDGNVIDGMTWIKTQQQLLKQATDRVVAKYTGDLYAQLPEISDAELLNANRYGAGATMAGFANGGYGSLESKLQYVGSRTKDLKVAFRKDTETLMQGPLYDLLSNQEAAIEWSTINQKITRSADQWVRHTEGAGDAVEEYLISKTAAKKYVDDSGELDWDSLFAEAPNDLIQIKNPATVAAVDNHIARTGARTQSYQELRATQGYENVRDTSTFQPIRPNFKDYPFIAFVRDPKVTQTGHTTMIFANSESKLQELINKVPGEFEVVTKRDVEDFKRARGEYEYARTLNESNINSQLKKTGAMSEFFTHTDPQKIVNDILQQHLREDDTLAVELMRAKYQKTFDWLEDQGDAYTKVSASKLGSYSDRLESAGKNPYLDYIKTALDISKASEHPWLYGFNKLLDGAVSRVVGNISDVWNEWKAPLDTAKVDQINSLLDKYGMNTGYKDAATLLLADHAAPKGELTKFIRGANALMSKLTLGLDPLNALNNFIGANVLRGTELKQITDAITAGNTELGGKLADLAQINLPGGVGSITAPTKLVAKAFQNLIQDDGTLVAQYKAQGFIKDSVEQFKQILDDFTLKGTESVSDLSGRLQSAFQKAKQITQVGEKLTGNKLAEETNRFISADVMRQLTDLGVEHGLLTPQDQLAYINTFVNRVEGNTIASQRPLMFQGPIGQAIGLFQSYQFNLMQQMFRYVAEGSAKDSAMLLGLQGTFYGVQGLPAFQFINKHVVGTLSGNDKHVDLYDATYGIAGKSAGDLLLYGLPSNLLQANLYSRGDINPRQVTVVPTSLADVPIVGAFGKFLGSVKDAVDKVRVGGNVWESMLQGLEHNGLSRPLAGLAQTLQAAGPNGQVYSTTSKDSILFSNDFMSWATATRLAGGRPLDEAVINDSVYRIQAYQQFDRDRMKNLGEAVKSATIQGNTMSEDQVVQFAKEYAASGGKQAGFNKFVMEQFKAANTSQAEKIVTGLKNPFAQKLQVLMGGGDTAVGYGDGISYQSQF